MNVMLDETALSFLAQNSWSDAQQTRLAADFSLRRFVRLEKDSGARAVLMIAEANQNTDKFLAVDKILRDLNLSAPEIYAADLSNNPALVLMEDLGDVNYGRMVDRGVNPMPLYQRGVDVLVQLHQKFEPAQVEKLDLPTYDGDMFTAILEKRFLNIYFPHILKREATDEERLSFRTMWQQVLTPLSSWPQTLILRDYILDNLMDLPTREGARRSGILDFQDAGLGSLPYDVASLCECIRRDTSEDLLKEVVSYYHNQNPIMDKKELLAACTILSAQRHIRILGNVAYRPEKWPMLPRIENYAKSLLKNETLAPVRAWLKERKLLNDA